jgi:hypothetical protein
VLAHLRNIFRNKQSDRGGGRHRPTIARKRLRSSPASAL